MRYNRRNTDCDCDCHSDCNCRREGKSFSFGIEAACEQFAEMKRRAKQDFEDLWENV